MQKRIMIGVMAMVAASANAIAGQMCGKQRVADHARTCANGESPIYVADAVKPARQNHAADSIQADNPASANYYFGVWRTRIPGAAWTSPGGYQGYDWLRARAGVSVGDLIIKPNGTYVWNSNGGKSGRWYRGDAAWPLVLIDTVENRQWKIGADRNRTGERDIIVWDGSAFQYDGRK